MENTHTMRIEMDRGDGWELRSEGTVSATSDEAAAQITAYAYSNHAHRILLDGAVVAVHTPKRRRVAL
jgi:hypothetical protein